MAPPTPPDDGPGPTRLYDDQIGLLIFTIVAVAAGLYFVAKALLG